MLGHFNLFSDRLAIDPGTDRTLLYNVKNGIVINEPSVIAVSVSGNSRPHIVAVGEAAGNMQGKTPAQIEVVHPIRNGAIANFEATGAMLKHFIKAGCKRRKFSGFQAMIAVPSGITQKEMEAAIGVVKSAGADKVFLIEGPVAGALGAGLPITEPTCNMVVDIGGGTTEVVVISLGGVVSRRSVRVAGCRMNTAISNFIKRKYDLLIGNLSAEIIKTTIGTACPNPKGKKSLNVKGRDLTTGMPRVIQIGPGEIREAISVEIGAILQTVRSVLEELPPELAADVLDRGILLTGGGALLEDLDQLLSEEIGLTITVPKNPSSTVVQGAARVLDDMDGFNQFVLN
ncbi:MAG: rod shape-determining protein [Desulfobacterales bacterium]